MSIKPVDVWTNAALPPGSGRYYACLHTNNPQYTAAIVTLYSIWSKLCFSNKEMDAARQQVEWWQNELTLVNPQHPVTSALQQSTPDQCEFICTQLSTTLNGYASLLSEGSPSRAPAAKKFHNSTGALAARTIAGPTLEAQYHSSIENVGIALSKFRCIRYAHQHAANGLLCLPFESMSEAGVSPSDLIPGQYSQTLQAFLQKQLAAINADFERFFNECSGNTESYFLYIYAKLQQQLLLQFQNNLLLLQDADYRLLPLKYLWHSYKAKRHLIRTNQS